MAQTIQLTVTGMTCDHCVRSVTKALQDVPGVTSATVSLSDKAATVFGDGIELSKLIEAVKEEGYEAAAR